MTRNERRKAAQQRLLAKTERIVKAHIADAMDKNRKIVRLNLDTKIERNYYPEASMSRMAGNSHRGYVCKASGAMSRQGAQASAMKVANRVRDHYAKPVGEDRSLWPVV